MPRRAAGSQTFNIHGGVGGHGGGSGLGLGGRGGTGEGPQLQYEIKAEYFTMNNNLLGTTSDQPQSQFRPVNLGDLNLLEEIDNQGVIERRPTHQGRTRTGSVTIQRIYKARIFGNQDPMTAIVYDGPKFEQRLAQARDKQGYRNPLLAQLFGFTRSAGVNALIYHDEMMTIAQIRGMHATSVLALLYLEREMELQFSTANSFWESTTGNSFLRLSGNAWIRLSTGKLCVDVGNGEELAGLFLLWQVRTELPSIKFTENDLGDKILSRLKLDDLYHLLTHRYTRDVAHLSSTLGTIMLPSLCRIPDPGADFDATEISAIPIANHFTPSSIYVKSWDSPGCQVETLATGWTRVDYLDSHGRLSMDIRLVDGDDARKWWFSQQGYVIAQLQDASSFDDEMGFVTEIDFNCTIHTPPPDNFTLQGTFMADAPTDDVYLFIFSPKVDLVDGRFIVTSPPVSERYYWAFDPAGLDRLNCQTAEDVGLPAPEFSIKLWGLQWDETRHNLIRDFHAAKGFDPCSQDMAVAMGYPLVHLEDIKKFAQEPTARDCPDVGIEDGIYYSFGLC